MGAYRISGVPSGVEVRHVAVFPLAFGIVCAVGALGGLVLWATDLQDATGANYWGPLLILAGTGCAAFYLILFQHWLKRVVFVAGSKELEVMDKALAVSASRRLTHAGLETFAIRERDSDGRWYTLAIRLDDGRELDIGFGCATAELARSTVDQIVEMCAHAESGRHGT